jgi:stage V sporulation protein G
MDGFLLHFLPGNGIEPGRTKPMQITDVRMRKVEADSQLKAVASITINDEFVVHDIKVIEGEKGLFIAMPSRKAGRGEFRDIAHPLNSATREHIQNMILNKYQDMIQEQPQVEYA